MPVRTVLRILLMVLAVFPGFASSKDEPTVLRFRYWGDIKEVGIINSVVKDFERAHPGVKVRAERAPSGDSYTQKVLVEFAGGTAPDVLFVEVNIFVTLAEKGVLMPLNDLMRDTNFPIEEYYPKLVDRFTVRGQVYTIPRDIAPVCCIYYNKKLFDEAGVPYPTDDWSWSPDPDRVAKQGIDPNKDFLTVAKKLTRVIPGSRNKQYGIDLGWEPLVYTNGGRLVDDVKNPTRLRMSDPKVTEAIQFRADLMNKYKVMPSPTDLQSLGVGTPDLFMSGKLAMYFSGIWNTPQFRDIKAFDWDVAVFPRGPNGVHEFPTGGSGYSIARTTKHPDLAWELVRYLSGKEGMSRLAATGLAQPAIRKLAESPVWIDGKNPRNKQITLTSADRIVFLPFTPAWNEMMSKINPELDLVWLGKQTAQQALDKSEPLAQKVLDEYRREKAFQAFPWKYGVLAFFALLALIVAAVWWFSRHEWTEMKSRLRRADARAGYLFILPWILGFLIFTIGPVIASFLLAFCQWDLIKPAQWVGLYNFAQILGQDELFRKSLWNTLVFTVFSVPLGMVGSLAVTMLLNTKAKGLALFRTMYYLPAVTSAVAASVLWIWIFNPEFGLLNTFIDGLHLTPVANWLGLLDPEKQRVLWLGDERLAKPSLILMGLWGVGGGMIIFLAGLQSIPNALYEAAHLDGAGPFHRFRHVTIPMLTPTIFFSLIMGVIGSFQVFTQAFVMTSGGPHNATLFYVLYLYQNAFQFLRMGYASALAWLLFAVILVVTMIQFKFSHWVYYEGAEQK